MKGPAGSSVLHIHSGLPTLLYLVSHSRLKYFAAGTRFSYDFMMPDLLSFQGDHRRAFLGSITMYRYQIVIFEERDGDG